MKHFFEDIGHLIHDNLAILGGSIGATVYGISIDINSLVGFGLHLTGVIIFAAVGAFVGWHVREYLDKRKKAKEVK